MNLLRSNSRHPGWPLNVGPLRVPAGLIRLRAVRMRDGAQWSRIRMADRAHLEPWEPSGEGEWTVRHAAGAWPALCSGLRSEARKGRMLPSQMYPQITWQFEHTLTLRLNGDSWRDQILRVTLDGVAERGFHLIHAAFYGELLGFIARHSAETV